MEEGWGEGINGFALSYNNVVGVLLESMFTLGNLPESPAGTASKDKMQTAAMLVALFAHLRYLLAVVLITIRISCQINNAKVNTQHANWFA